MNVGLVSYAVACAAYVVLTILLTTTWRGRLSGLLVIVATVASAVWAGASAIAAGFGAAPAGLLETTEFVRDAAWLVFLARILAAGAREEKVAGGWWRVWMSLLGVLLLVGASLTVALPFAAGHLRLPPDVSRDAHLIGWVLLAVLGLLLVEQVFRNRPPGKRWAIKHLCLGLGGVFAYDLFMYSDGLLMHRIGDQIWAARGVVNALVVPLVAVSAARNPSWALEVHVSRKVVFHTATLSGAGLYLLAMAGAGYYIKHFGGTWGTFLQAAFLFGGVIFLFLLLFSGEVRTRLRLLLSQHFFSFKYDYRQEWLRFTETLAKGGDNIAEAVLRGLAEMIGSPGGAIWIKRDAQVFELAARAGTTEPEDTLEPADGSLVRFLVRSDSLVDLDEYPMQPESYEGLAVPAWLDRWDKAWLVVPLVFQGELNAFVVLARPQVKPAINWEDRDLLKTAGRQAASHIAQQQADQALMQARQFEAFSKLSAYVAHDLKNLLAQHSLIVANAEKHKHNPAFIEDVVGTLRSSVDRMNRLMVQLRNGIRGEDRVPVRVDLLVAEVARVRSRERPVPVIETNDPELVVEAERERLATVFGHIIQNAQEATRADRKVVVRSFREGDRAVVEVEDEGSGMSPEFIRDRLFRPFDSTKGLTGMGIGAFESREFVRALGGDLLVKSTPGQGTLFRISLPCMQTADEGVSDIGTIQETTQ